MNAGERAVIYHLCRKDGTSVFLHPFTSPSKLIFFLDRSGIEGRYGLEPKVENLSRFRDELYRMIEQGVRSWVTDLRFMPNFLISAAVFVLTALVLYVAVPDPVPFLDEILIGGCVSAAAFFLIRKRDMKSDPVLKKRVAYRTAVDRIVFLESPFVHTVESLLHSTEGGNEREAMETLVNSREQFFGKPHRDDAERFLHCLELTFDGKKLRRQERILRRISKSGTHTGRNVPPGFRRFVSGKIDFPLFILYSRLKREFEYAG